MIKSKEIEFETFPPDNSLWRTVPMIKNGVKAIHIPTGKFAICQLHRSPHINKITAVLALERLINEGTNEI